MTETKPHHGRNIKRFREMLDIKQETLADELHWSQQKVSLLEQKEIIEDDLLQQIAKVLKVPAEAIKNFDTEQAINNINNNFHDNAIQNQIHPLEKVIELYEIKIVALYERLLESEKQKNELLERMLKEK